jgi:hypothetical protein
MSDRYAPAREAVARRGRRATDMDRPRQGEAMSSIDATDDAAVEARLRDLEAEMPQLYLRHTSVFALASAWAERHDAILAIAPPEQRADVEARLARIGIRWGVMPGSRVTVEFRVSDIEELARARRRPRRP